ncbi:unnamed protein product [Sympodiomycopsis kandeliae]
MARLKKRGESGAAKNYITRNQALKKLQISLSDFRRLCILKGIHPQQPRHSKRANKGSSAPATFYYAKDIVYLAHEPILKSLRDHKSFAKKLSRAIGRKEWAAAKNLEDAKPQYTLDHIIKQRYPTFDEALGDIDDALCTIVLFANLPAKMYNLPEGVVDTCSRLKREWDEYVVRSGALKKTFLSIKGIYFQATIRGKDITWLVPYPFTQHVPHDVDFRVMSTFLELYTTLLSFVLFKLWSDMGESYPPQLEDVVPVVTNAEQQQKVNEEAEKKQQQHAEPSTSASASGSTLSKKAIRKTIRSIEQNGKTEEVEVDVTDDQPTEEDDTRQGFSSVGAKEGIDTLPLPSDSNSEDASSKLFRNCTFYLDRSTPLNLLTFLLRSYGALVTRIGWDETLAPNSPLAADDSRITHVLVDRPSVSNKLDSRKYVQPQWVVDCANKGSLLPEEEYEIGKILPPHLSPFVVGGAQDVADAPVDEEMSSDDDDEAEAEAQESEDEETTSRPALQSLLESSSNPKSASEKGLLDSAELEAEVIGGEAEIERVRALWTAAVKKSTKSKTPRDEPVDEDLEAKKMSRGLLSNRQRKLYDKLSYTKNKNIQDEKSLQTRREEIKKDEKRKAKKQASTK